MAFLRRGPKSRSSQSRSFSRIVLGDLSAASAILPITCGLICARDGILPPGAMGRLRGMIDFLGIRYQETTMRKRLAVGALVGLVAACLVACSNPTPPPTTGAHDPGVRGGAAGAGKPLPGLTSDELAFFNDGRDRFLEIESVKGSENSG